jgi:hypothetical protein
MLFRMSLGLATEAEAVERAVADTIERGVVTPDLAAVAASPSSTMDVAAAVAERVGAFLIPERVVV